MKIAYAFACMMIWLTPAAARPCASCATITDRAAQDEARARSTSRKTDAGVSCATMSDPVQASYCRARSGGR